MKKTVKKPKPQSQIEALTEKFAAGQLSTKQYLDNIKASDDGDQNRRKIIETKLDENVSYV